MQGFVSNAQYQQMEKRPWLEIAEYTAIVTSVVGTVAAVKIQQLLYASAPLAVALSLNLINRQRFQQKIKEYTSNAIADVRQVAQPLLEQAEIPVENVYLSVNLGSITELLPTTDKSIAVANNDPNFVLSKSQTISPKEVIIELQNLTNEIHQGVDKLASCLKSENIDDIKLEISTIKQHLQAFDINYIVSNIEQLKIQINSPSEQYKKLPSVYDIIFLAQKIAELEHKNSTIFNEYTKHILPEIIQIQSKQASSKQEIQYIRNKLNYFEIKLEKLADSSEVDMSHVVKAIAPIQAHISAIGSIPEQITQLKLDLQDLQEQIKYERPYNNHNGYRKN